jgi:hypothetical protein
MLIQQFQSSWKIPCSLKITNKNCQNGVNVGQKNALTWYESQDLIFKKNYWTLNQNQQHQNQYNLHGKHQKIQMNWSQSNHW